PCQNSSTQIVTVTAADDASFTLTDFCVGQTNAAAGIITAGGTFSFNPVPTDGATINPTTGEISSGISGTTYTIEYTTPTGPCQNSSTQIVTVTAADDASFTLTDFCVGQTNAAAGITTAGGTFSFNPVPTDGATINPATGEITTGVAGATYTIEYTTPAGPCQNSSTQTVTVTTSDDASFTLTDFCVGQTNTASAIATPGGTFTFNPVPTDGATINPTNGEVTNGVAGTTYTVEYTTPVGACQNSSTQTVTVTAADDASFILTDFCENATNTASGIATTGGTFTFNPVPTDGATINPTTGEISSGVSGTTYTIEYTTPPGVCQNSSTQTVTVTAADDASFTLTNFCVGQTNTASGITTVGGTFTFNPVPTDGATINPTTGEVSSGVAGNTYTIEYTTPVGPCQNSSTQTVTVTAADDASFTLTNFCVGQTNAAANITTVGGTFSFNPVPTDGATINPTTGEVSNGIVGTTYTVEYITPAGPCQNSSTQTVTVNPCTSPISGYTVSDTILCEGDCISFTDQSIGATSWEWTFNNGSPSTSIDQNPTNICFNTPGNHIIEQIVSNGNGADTTTSIVVVHPTPTISAGPNVTIELGNSVTLNATGSDGTYNWIPPTWLDCPTCPNPTSTPEETITYTVTVVDTNGCSISDDVTIIVNFDNVIWVANVFSPNGDDFNDILFVRGKGIANFQFFVYDRWGEKVFETQDLDKGWNGTFRGKKMNNGVFVYYLKATFIDGAETSQKGDITLIR
ncbi:MAG: gliding motility-associated C-terminal domain-containing protein, partial [Flavobacteriales bacterium]|nr:gliding motility-associated C-terminal domain-containing protein [Flavobacteriales bacterium]